MGARGFVLDMADAATWPGERWVSPAAPGLSLRNAVRALSVFLGGTLVGSAGQFGFHELGHGSRAAAVGYRPFYGRGSPGSVDAVLADRRRGALTTHWLPFTLGSVFSGTGGYTAVFDDEARFPILTDEVAGWGGPTAMGGLNFEMLLADGIEERSQAGGTSTGMLALYASSKLAARDYAPGSGPLNDITNILDFYQEAGEDVSYEDIRSGGLVALFGSGLFYELVLRFGRSFTGGDTRFTAFRYGGFTLPNTAFYLNAEGTSYRVTSSWRSGSLVLPFGVELPQSGSTGTEYTVGARYEGERWHAAATTYLGQGLGTDLQGGLRLGAGLWATGGYARIDRKSLAGARVIGDLRNGKGNEWYLGLRVSPPRDRSR